MKTRASLLLRIRDPDDAKAWAEFVELYAPLLHAYAMKHGMQDADAADLAQDMLLQMLQSASEFAYDPARGSFRGWLLTVARNRLRKNFAAATRSALTGDSHVRRILESVPEETGEQAWDEDEHRRRLLRWATDRLREQVEPPTWHAFWRTAVLGESVESVSQALGLSPGAVYVARSRMTARLRTLVHSVENGNDFERQQ